MGTKKNSFDADEKFQLIAHIKMEIDIKVKTLKKGSKIDSKQFAEDIQHLSEVLSQLNSEVNDTRISKSNGSKKKNGNKQQFNQYEDVDDYVMSQYMAHEECYFDSYECEDHYENYYDYFADNAEDDEYGIPNKAQKNTKKSKGKKKKNKNANATNATAVLLQ